MISRDIDKLSAYSQLSLSLIQICRIDDDVDDSDGDDDDDDGDDDDDVDNAIHKYTSTQIHK